MKRPMVLIGFPFALAMWAAFLLDARQALLLSGAAAVTGLLVYCGLRRHLWVGVACFSMAASFGAYAVHFHGVIAPFQRAAGSVVTVEGIVSEVSVSSRSVDYTVEARFPKVPLPGATVVLRTYGESQASVGDVIRCKAELQPVSGSYYLSRGIRARGVAETALEQSEAPGYAFPAARLALRTYFQQNLYDALPRDSADVIGAMVMKISLGIDAGVYNHMNRSGISHLLAISGLHFSVLTTFILESLRKTALPRRIPELLTILAGILFVVITGFSASILRAFVMFFIMMLGRLSLRRSDPVNSLGAALLVICLIWPQWTQTTGMWLSAAATLGILLQSKLLDAWMRKLLDSERPLLRRVGRGVSSSLAVSLSAYVFTMPLLMLTNGWISLVALPANVLIAPFVMPVLLGGLLCCLFPAGSLAMSAVAAVADFCLRVVLAVSELLAGIPLATASLDQAWKLIWICLAVLLAAIALARKGGRQLVAWAVMLAVCGYGLGGISAAAADRDRVELVTLADCNTTLVLRRNQAVLIGAPDRFATGKLLRYLDYRGIGRISLLVATGSDDRVHSGLLRLGEDHPVDAVVGPADGYVLDQLSRIFKGAPVYSPDHGEVRALGGILLAADGPGGRVVVSTGAGPVAIGSAPDAAGGGIEVLAGGGIEVLAGGRLSLPEGIGPVLEPVGERIYGETRVLLPIIP